MSKFFEYAAPYLAGAGSALINADTDDSGADDFAGHLMVWGGEVIASVIANEDIPDLPDVITEADGGLFGPLSGAGRATIAVVTAVLSVTQIQLTIAGKPRAAKAVRYVVQALNALTSGKAMPAPSF